MGKTVKGPNQKAAAASARKASVADAKAAAAATAAEDAAWRDDRPKKKHELKKEAGSDKADAALARKAELKALQAAEDAELAQLGKPKGKGGNKKITQFDIAKRKAAEDAALAADAEAISNSKKNITVQSELAPNANRKAEGEEDATGVDAAIELLSTGDVPRRVSSAPAMAASESSADVLKRAALDGRVTSKLFEKSRMEEIKIERPGLKASQYRDHLKKEWQRSPYNPNNAAS